MRIEEAELRDALRPILADAGTDREAVWSAIAEAGWTALLAPEAAGGLAQPLTAACWLYMEAGRALSSAPLLPALLASDVLDACPPSGGREEWLGRLAGGERIATPLFVPAAASVRLEDGRLSGAIAAVDGVTGDGHVLVVSPDPGLVALLPRTAFEAVARSTWDDTRSLHDVTVDSLPIGQAIMLAEGTDALPAIDRYVAHLHFGVAADCVGAADAILAETVAYLQTRRQFDRPLAMFQALKHRCADLKAEIAAAEALVRDRLAAAGSGEVDAVAAARGAKAFAAATFRLVTEEAMQLHGGIAMTQEHGCHRYLKRALLNEQLASPGDACELAVADAVIART